MKMTIGLLSLNLIMMVTTMVGCASQPQLTHDQALSQNPQVANLNTALLQARDNGAELLAPESYTEARRLLDRAMSAAQSNNNPDAQTAANQGLKLIPRLNRDTENSRQVLSEVLQVRDRAYAAGVSSLKSVTIAELDNDLKNTAALIEAGNIEKAKQRRPKLIADYSQLELEALKQGTADLARTVIASAKQQGADKHAPKTLAQAEEELALAVSILDADRTQTDKADIHAKKASWLAEKSAAITETIKDFDRRDYTLEDIVLSHQQQLETINEPLGGQLPFNEPNDSVVLGLRNSVASVVNERNLTREQLQKSKQQAQGQLKATEEQLKATEEKYQKKLAMTEKERQSQQQKEREDKLKFERVQAMFNEDEANVYRQRENVLISAHGFQFPIGQSEIQTGNFPLMNKIILAIQMFPGARIEVSGHTDATGNDTTNQLLSDARAGKVAKFLIEVGGIKPANITSRGFGESRPVATNETPKGRAENRRVEIKIVNQ